MKALRFVVAVGAPLALAAHAAAEVAVGGFASGLTTALLQPGTATGAAALAALGAVAAWPRRRTGSVRRSAEPAPDANAIVSDYTVWGEPTA